jgi:DNA topoisomerase-1
VARELAIADFVRLSVGSAATFIQDRGEASAADVALVYANDGEPGIRRRRAGTGSYYVWPDGERIRDPDVLERIRGLVIPPAWTDVWIAPSADFHLQVTGKDARGRKQYRYHERWNACRDEVKYSTLIEFARALPRLREAVEADLDRRTLAREKVVATVVRLLDTTMIRVGNPAYARDNGSFGLTTFRNRHVRIEGSSLRFSFKGKSGKEWQLKVTDRRIARIVKATQDLPGQHLFQYVDDDGARRRVTSQDVNGYIRAAAEGPFSSKHFRTWGGTVQALLLFSEVDPPETKRGLAVASNKVIDAVSRRLGNTRAVCRKCYVHPLVVASWEAGRLADEVAAVRRRFRRAPAGLGRTEHIALKWLETTADNFPRPDGNGSG